MRVPLSALLCVGAFACASPALAWGAYGHRFIGEAAALAAAPELPAFLKTPAAVGQLGELAREPDRGKGAGQPHDADLDPGHFVDLDEQGRVLGGPSIETLPPSREVYVAALVPAGIEPQKAGWLPYSILDGWQQLVRDFALWRVDQLGTTAGKTARQRAWFKRDLTLREAVTIRDLGYWSHFVGDGSQPMHVSVHYNGWGDYPNPEGLTQDKVHGPFEGAFVHANVTLGAVRAALPPPAPCDAPVAACVARYLSATQATVTPFYRLWKAGGFKDGDPRGTTFATERLAAGAAELRDLTTLAWRASEEASVGYPPVKVREVLASKQVPYEQLYGVD